MTLGVIYDSVCVLTPSLLHISGSFLYYDLICLVISFYPLHMVKIPHFGSAENQIYLVYIVIVSCPSVEGVLLYLLVNLLVYLLWGFFSVEQCSMLSHSMLGQRYFTEDTKQRVIPLCSFVCLVVRLFLVLVPTCSEKSGFRVGFSKEGIVKFENSESSVQRS